MTVKAFIQRQLLNWSYRTQRRRAGAAPLQGGHLLLIAADSQTRQQLTTTLREENHQVTAVPDVQAGLERLNEPRSLFQVVVLATEAGASVENSARTAQVFRYLYPALQVVISASLSTQQLREAFLANVTDCLEAPSDSLALKQSVRRALELHNIFNFYPSLKNFHLLSEALKLISSCQDSATLSRLATSLLAGLFGDGVGDSLQIGMFAVDPNAANRQPDHFFQALQAFRMDRLTHRQLGIELSRLYQNRWRLFNRPHTLSAQTLNLNHEALLAPLRHQDGLWGALVMVRTDKRRSRAFTLQEKALVQVLGQHLVRTYQILQRYEDLGENQFRDSLTGLYNGSYLQQFAEAEIIKAYHHNYPVTLLHLNVRGFRKVNDEYGHLVGAQLLRFVGGLIKQLLRKSDIAARLDADSFTLILINTPESGAQQMLQRLLELVASNGFVLPNKNRLPHSPDDRGGSAKTLYIDLRSEIRCVSGDKLSGEQLRQVLLTWPNTNV